MRILDIGPWRPFFMLAALLILAGGPQHPRGTMAEMLAHPKWVPSHALMLAGFVALLIGLVLYQRGAALPERTRWWTRLAVVATAFQVVEMVFHTIASVDHAHLVAGEATPILTTHLWLSVVLYPLFGLALAGLIVMGARERALGSLWTAWLGILGALAHGAAAPLVIVLQIQWARILFPCLMFFALWLVVAALWPSRGPAEGTLGRAPLPT